MSNDIHPTAIVSDRAQLGTGNHIGPFAIIEDEATLGDNNTLMAGAVIKSGTRLGNGNQVHEYTVLGGLPQDVSFDPATPSFVEVGDNNVFREYVTVHRGSKPEAVTRIGNQGFYMTEVHIAHDCQLADLVIIAPSTGLGGHVAVGKKAFISGGVMVHQFVHIGEFAMIGGNAKITQDALPFMTTDGNPARVVGMNKVGLRRAGFGREDLAALKEAYQRLFREADSLEAKLEQIQALDHPLASRLVAFIRAAKRGFHRDRL